MLPKDFSPVSTVRSYFYRWRNDGTLTLMNLALGRMARQLEGKDLCPSAGIIDSQSVKTTESDGVCGYDAGKKVKGCKRHIVTDTNGFMVGLAVHSAAIQNRNGTVPTLQSIRRFYPFLRHVFADGGYAGDKLRRARKGKGTGRLRQAPVGQQRVAFVAACLAPDYPAGLCETGRYRLTCWIPAHLLNTGEYSVNIHLVTPDIPTVRHAKHDDVLSFFVRDAVSGSPSAKGRYLQGGFPGPVRPMLRWDAERRGDAGAVTPTRSFEREYLEKSIE